MKRRSEQIKILYEENTIIREKIERMQAKIEANLKRIENLKQTPEYKQERQQERFHREWESERLRLLIMNGKIAN